MVSTTLDDQGDTAAREARNLEDEVPPQMESCTIASFSIAVDEDRVLMAHEFNYRTCSQEDFSMRLNREVAAL